VAPPGKGSDYAAAGTNSSLRTGVRGQCLKLGTSSPDRSAEQCDAGTGAAAQPVPKSPAVARPAAPKMEAKSEPVEVKPLAPQPAKEERVLEPESAPVASPEPAPMPKPAPAPAKETVTLSADTLFSLGSAAIKTTAREDLDAFLTRMKGMDFESIKIIGHTDPTGSAEGNIKLSRERAESVKRYLVAKGLDGKRIQTEGVGGSQPVATGLDCSKLPRAAKIVCLEPNRRVEIEVIGAMPKMAERK
jgi:outer membrane protein OmpA-like peptidoglycan-associated protein